MIQNTGLEITAKLERLPLLSNFIGNSMFKFGLSEYQQFQVQIAVEEVVTNVIKHGTLEDNDKISVKCQKKDNEIVIVIENPGKPFNPTNVEKLDLNTSSLKPNSGGLRVYFIKKYINKVNYEFEDDKNILTLIKRI
jgi:anti-sigma regulatory factor (Ser/Thr protein kinase)